MEKRSLVSYGLEMDSSTVRLLVGGFLLGISSMLTLIALHLNFFDSSIQIKELSIHFVGSDLFYKLKEKLPEVRIDNE